MNTEIKAIFFDLDGTLVDKKTNQIPISTQIALRELHEKGIRLFIASGCPPLWAASIRKQFDFEFDGKILLNGQYCVDEKDTPFYKNPLSKVQCRAILNWIKKNPTVECNFMEPNYVYTNIRSAHDLPVEDAVRCLAHETYQISPQVSPEFDNEILQ